ncbi:MAG: carbohydrate binding domain-containing protein [Clostridia bacterium]|nr:carbohydrate binding domain-containing protein [Clostridia bacterium]
MKNRALAMLLSATLVLSSLPMTAFATDGTVTAVSSELTWSDNVTEVSDTIADDVTDDYVHLYGIAQVERKFDYMDPTKKLDSSKTYRLSFMIRGVELHGENGFERTVRVCLDSNATPLSGSNIIGSVGADPATGNITVPENEWKSVYYTFKGNDKALKLIFENSYSGYSNSLKSVTPYDIRALSLYEINGVGHDVGSNLIEYSLTKNPSATSKGWAYYSNKVEFCTESDFLRVANPTDGTPASAKLSGLTLEPGKYSVSANFRLNTLDFDVAGKNASGYYNAAGYTVNLSASENNGDFTFEGATTLALTTEWKAGSFTIDAPKAVTAGELSLALDKAVGFDISDFEITKLVSYTDDYEAVSGANIEQKGSADASEYIYVYNVKSATAYPTYKDSTVTLDASKTYTLSFKLRADASSDANTALGYKSSWGDANLLRLTQVRVVDGRIKDSIKLYDTWSEYSVEFTGKGGPLKIWFTEQGYDELVPFSIADLSLKEKGSDVELIKNGTAIDAENGWSLNNANASIMAVKDTEYYTVPASASNNAFNCVGDRTPLTSGVWKVTGEFRLNDYKIANLDRTVSTGYDVVSANNNKAELEVIYNGEALETTDGTLSATVTTIWNGAEFVIAVPNGESIEKSELVFTLSDGSSFDFRNVEFVDISDQYSDEYIGVGGEPIAKTEIATANEYIYVNKVKSASAYVTYNDSSVVLDENETYTLSFRLRGDISSDFTNSNASKYRNTRVRVIDGVVKAGIELTNEWTEHIIPITGKKGVLQIAFIEQTFADILPYSIDDLSLLDSAGNELIKHGMEIGFDGWSVLSSDYTTSSNNATVSVAEETTYYTVPASASQTQFKYNGTNGHLDSGIYHITGEFRLADYMYSKLETSTSAVGWVSVTANNNNAYLSAVNNGQALNLVDSDSTELFVSTDWTSGEFLLRVENAAGIEKSEIVFTLSDGTPLDFKNIEFVPADELYIDSFVSGDGSLISIVNEEYESYVRTYGINYVDDAKLTYQDSSVTLSPDKTYRISFDARTASIKGETGDYFDLLKYNYGKVPTDIYRNIRIFLVDANGNGVGVDNLLNGEWLSSPRQIYASGTELNASGQAKNTLFKLYDEWAEYTSLEFKPQNNATLKIMIMGSGTPDILPYDIADLSVVEIDPDTGAEKELVKYGAACDNAHGWSAVKSSATICGGEEYYNVPAPTDGSNTSIQIVSEDGETLSPGVYHITGKFRLAPPLDAEKFSVENGKLTGDSNGASIMAYATTASLQLKTVAGRDEASVSPYGWQEVEFVLETETSVDIDTIGFMLDGAYSLDFCEISITLVERKVELNDINTGVIVTLLILKKQQIDEMELDKFITPSGDFIEKMGSAEKNDYLRIYNITAASAYLTYSDSTVTLDPTKTYELKFKLRTDNCSDYMDVRSSDGQIRLARLKVVDGVVLGPIRMSTEWTDYSVRFTGKSGPLSIQFIEQSFWDLLPYCVDDFSLIDVSTGKELIRHGLTIGTVGWSTTTRAELAIVSDGEYYHVNSPESGNTAFKYNGSEKELTKENWYVTGEFRLADYQFAKLEYSEGNFGWINIDKNNNKATLNALLNGKALPTTSGSDGVTVTNEWTKGGFVIEVDDPSKISLNNIVFTLSDGTPLEFRNVEFYSETDKNMGLIRGAVSKEALENWSYGEQTLEYKVDEDGTEYLAARNIANNYLGFTYNAQTTIEPGTYIFSGDFRTANKGETGYTRVKIAGTPYTIKINNEWSHMEFVFAVDEKVPLEFIVRGPAITQGVQEYDIANLRIVNFANTIPNNVELYEKGTFDDGETAREGWATYNSSTAKLTYEEEDGNGFLRMSERSNEYCGIQLSSDLYLASGIRYKLSYDIRCSNEGDEMAARSYLRSDPLAINGETLKGFNFMYMISHEWRHIEAEFVAKENGNLIIKIAGGMDPTRDICSFDIDNISIVKLGE